MNADRGAMRASFAIKCRAIAVLLTLLFVCNPAVSDDGKNNAPAANASLAANEATTSASDVKHTDAKVVVFNRPIVHFRAAFLGMPAIERAATARERIILLLDRATAGVVTVEPAPQGAVIRIDGAFAFIVSHEDVDAIAGESAMLVAENAAGTLRQAIAETHEARSLRTMAIASGWAAAATVVLLVLLVLLRRVLRFAHRRLSQFADSVVVSLRSGEGEIARPQRLLSAILGIVNVSGWLIALLLVYQWLGFVLRRFPFTRPWGEQLAGFLVDTTVGMLEAVARAMPGLAVAIVIFVVAHWLAAVLRHFFQGVEKGQIAVDWLAPDTARPTRKLVTIVIWLFALAMAYPYLPGSDTDAFKGISVLLGLMVSVGSSGLVAQAASGLIMMYTHTYRRGEYVRINDNEGTVVDVGMFTLRIHTGLGEELTLPNSLVMGAVTRNYSRAVSGPGYILDTTVTIGYDAPWRHVEALLIDAAVRTSGVLTAPAPRVFQTSLSDFYVEYRLVCHAIPSEPRPRAEILSLLHANIQDVFNESGVQIMSPHYLGDPAEPKIVPKAKWHPNRTLP